MRSRPVSDRDGSRERDRAGHDYQPDTDKDDRLLFRDIT